MCRENFWCRSKSSIIKCCWWWSIMGRELSLKLSENMCFNSGTIWSVNAVDQPPSNVLQQSTSRGNLPGSSNPRQSRRRILAETKQQQLGLAGRWLFIKAQSTRHTQGNHHGFIGWRLLAVNCTVDSVLFAYTQWGCDATRNIYCIENRI